MAWLIDYFIKRSGKSRLPSRLLNIILDAMRLYT